MSARAFLVLPTWLLYRAIRPALPRGHMLKAPRPLGEWAAGATDLTLRFSAAFWVIGWSFALAAWLWSVTP